TTQPAPSKPQAKPEKVKVTKATAQPVVKASPKAIAQTAKPPVAAPLPNNVINNITNTTKTEPTEKPKAAVTNEVPKPAVTNDNTSNPKVTRRDRDLKNEILRTFQDQFANNQLTVEVNQTDVVVSGSVATQEQLERIKPLLLSVQGIGNVEVTAIAKMPTN
ncbi:MAG: hypothetical protein ACRC6M_13320, partial [Microcystaceae cyanobacterium]